MGDEAVMLFVEAQRVPDPTDSNITPHLSLPHGERLGRRNVARPSRPRLVELLYERCLSVIVRYRALERLDQRRIIILGAVDSRADRISDHALLRVFLQSHLRLDCGTGQPSLAIFFR